jgi:3',5'-cyclic AMP phosphodiesterase CpdA
MILLYHLTDTHYPSEDGALAAFAAAVVDGSLPRPDLLLHSGDLVNGAKDPETLRGQLAGARRLLDGTGIPWHMCCHTHDRCGDPIETAGESFREVMGQDFLQHLALDGMDVFMVSGSVTCSAPYRPVGGGAPPSWGYDLFDAHVVEFAEDFIAARARQAFRILVYHLPIGPVREGAGGDGVGRRATIGIGEEGRERILGLCRRQGIRLLLGGHAHLNSHRCWEGVHCVTTASFLDAPRGLRSLRWDGDSLHLGWIPWDVAGAGRHRYTLPEDDPLEAAKFHDGMPEDRESVIHA